MYETLSTLRPTELRIRTSPAFDLPKNGTEGSNPFLSMLVKQAITVLDRPSGFQEVETPIFQDNRLMKVIRFSALRTGRLYPPRNIPGTHICWRLSQLRGHSAAGRIMSMKNSNDTNGNRTCDLRACCAVLLPTAPRRAPTCMLWREKITDVMNISINTKARNLSVINIVRELSIMANVRNIIASQLQ